MSEKAASDVLEDFAARHGLQSTDALKSQRALIQAVISSKLSVDRSFSELDDTALRDPAVGILLTMLDRNFEHIEAAIAAYVTGSAPSAEVIARAACESSITVTYIVSGDSAARLRGHFEHYFSSVDDQVRKWRSEVAELLPDAREVHLKCAARRSESNAMLCDSIQKIFAGLIEKWPKNIVDRFRDIGFGTDYRTVYARAGSETHADAEETIRYFIVKSLDNSTFVEAMRSESNAFSLYLIVYAANFYLQALLFYSLHYRMSAAFQSVADNIKVIHGELHRLLPYIGAGFEEKDA